MDDEKLNSILDAIRNTNLDFIKDFISNNHDEINTITELGTMLQIASRRGKIDIVQCLIKNGADVNIGGGIANSPLVDAVIKGYYDIVELLCSNGAILDTKTFSNNPLFTAIAASHDEIAIKLIDHGIDITAKYDIGDIDGCDAMEYARQYGRTEIYEYLKEKMKK